MNYLKFTYDKLNIEQLQDLASSPKYQPGEISIFVETSSDNFNRQVASHSSYDDYESMALGILEVICHEIRVKWPEVGNIVIYLRLGSVPIQEASIVIAISSSHRKDAVNATEWCISYVKSRVPIWKKEVDITDEKMKRQKNRESHHLKRKIYCMRTKQRVYLPFTPRSQIKVELKELYDKIEKLTNEKRAEIDRNNIEEFIIPDRNPEFTCARIDSPFKKRPNSNSHLPVNFVMNTLHRDQFNADYLLKYIPPNGIEERLQNLEAHLGVKVPVFLNIDERLKKIEDRVKLLESLSPEYVSFWKKTGVFTKTKTKRTFSVNEIDLMIENLEKEIKQY